MIFDKFEMQWRLWLSKDGKKIFGRGPKELLKKTIEKGSLRQAAISMNMSYSKAWSVIKSLENELGCPILEKQIGGNSGGGSNITEEGKELIKKFEELENEIKDSVNKCFKNIFLNR